ncbi:MAG: DUF6744 family protein [Hydrogeniiclostridium mannosilyticum]
MRFEDFAAVSQDGGDVLGKVLYYSLSSILIDRDELESLCDAVGFPKGRSNRTAMGTLSFRHRRYLRAPGSENRQRPTDLQGVLPG